MGRQGFALLSHVFAHFRTPFLPNLAYLLEEIGFSGFKYGRRQNKKTYLIDDD